MQSKFTNEQAEQAILGTIILNNAYLSKVAEFLEEKHFYFTAHQAIWTRISEVTKEMAANQVTLKNFFETNFSTKDAGGALYISKLLSEATSFIDIKDCALVLVQLWQKRELERILKETSQKLEGNFGDIKNDLDAQISDLSFALGKEPRHISKIAQEVLKKSANKTRELLNFGFSEMDKMLGGLELGSFVIVAGKSSSGKTTACLNFAKSVSKREHVLFFSVEVNEDQIASKIIVEDASVNSYRLRTGDLNQGESANIIPSMERIEKYKLIIDDSSGLTLSKITARLKRLMNKYPIKLIVIDYLQLMKPEGKDFSREQQIAKIAIGLKEIAKEFNIVVMALSQLSRASDSRDNKKPMLSDLRDSGSLEQAADVVAFIHRDEYYLEREREPEYSKHYHEWLALYEASKGKADLIIQKNRNGKIGEVKFRFESEFGRFTEI